MDSTENNRSRVTAIWDAMARGDGAPFVESMAEDFVWRMTGSSTWSGTYSGKADVHGRMLRTLFEQFTSPYRGVARRIHADGDFVVVEYEGAVTNKRGQPYNNSYCMVIRMRAGQMAEVTEYMDTALVNRMLEPPPWA